MCATGVSMPLLRRCICCGVVMGRPLVVGGSAIHPNPVQSRLILQSRWYARGPPGSDRSSKNPLVRYLQTLRWVPIPLAVGFAYISYQQYGHVVKREEKKLHTTVDPEDLVATDWIVRLYKCLPLKIISRAWGRVNDLELPMWMRRPLFRSYIRAFGCNMEEVAIRDLNHYRNLGCFFRRRLRPSIRPIDSQHSMTCPSDGTVLHFGRAERGILEQVKGITYSMQDFLGPQSWSKEDHHKVAPPGGEDKNNNMKRVTPHSSHKRSNPRYAADLKKHSENELYHCVIYLAPGDYHGFHSPADWVIEYRRHFPGELLSVNPGVARLVRGLFNLNERAVYLGFWKHGFFCMTAVGATNVGNMKVYHDKNLVTNAPKAVLDGRYFDEPFYTQGEEGIPMKKGEPFGEFNLGSTIVLVFEAPKDFEFSLVTGQKVKYGQALGTIAGAPPSGK